MQSRHYKILIFLFIITTMFFLGTLTATAAPAARLPMEMKQPSGEVFTAELQGDEWFNYWMLKDTGAVIAKGEDGFWYYAKYLDEKIIAGNKKVKIDSEPKDVLKLEQLKKVYSSSILKAQALNDHSVFPQKAVSLSGTSQKVVVLLVEFNNVDIKNSETLWNREIFSMDTNSVNKYYSEVSNGTFHFEPAEENFGDAGVNDGVIKVRLNYAHPNSAGIIDIRNRNIVRNALIAADSYIDYSSFDTDKNGYISSSELHVVTIVAGYECGYLEKSPSVWSHRWFLDNGGVVCDGVTLCNKSYGGYTQQGEQYGDLYTEYMATIGNICHELGHDLGLPDLYDAVDPATSRGVGVHSLMGSGNWSAGVDGKAGSCPSHLDPWSKIELGFVTPTVVEGTGSYAMHGTGKSDYNILKIPTASSNEYFLVENRQFTGYDTSLKTYCKSGGIAIWHVDEIVMEEKRAKNIVNTDETHKAVDLEEANEEAVGYCQLDKIEPLILKGYNHYFYNGNVTTFRSASIPNSKLYNQSDCSISISTADRTGEIMAVTVKRPLLSITPAVGVGKEGRQYGVAVKLSDAYSLKSIDFMLKYDVNVMSIKNVTSSGISGEVVIDDTTVPGAVHFKADLSSVTDFPAETTIMTIDFDLTKYGITELKLEGVTLKNDKDDTVASTSQNSSIDIKPIVGNASGKIQLQGRKIYKDVSVTIEGVNIKADTDAKGNILLKDIPIGERTLIITYDYYLVKKVNINVLEDSTFDLGTIILTAGDANKDNKISNEDLDILKTVYRSQKSGTSYNAAADFNNDGTVDLVDLGILVTNLGLSGD